MTNTYKNIQVEIIKNTLNIQLNRSEKKNALNQNMISEIQDILNKHKNTENIRVVLISSNCDVFCSGADLNYLYELANFNYQQNLADSKILMKLFKTMLLYPKLIVSKVTGPAIAGGCGIATASDIIFATHNSKFGYPEVKIGFTPALVSTFLVNRVNTTIAQELLMTGKIINGDKALKLGLINYLYPDNEIQNAIDEFIIKFSQKTSPISIERTKKSIYIALGMEQKLQQAAEINAKSREGKDFQKGINAFINKQSINWENQ
mgnify:CR=1 FL=1|tara:strand:- start:1123 stop:1911 length:789 start_codon:yes stop_codon:yes gene_type:complete